MTILRELDWLDLEGWTAHLAELRAEPASASRDAQIADVEAHIASIRPLADTPEKRR